MNIRFRIGPFTFGKSGTRFSLWRGGTGFSIPLTNRRKNRSFGKVKIGPVSFHHTDKTKKLSLDKYKLPDNIKVIRKTHKQAYEPWTNEDDKKLILLFQQGKTIKELSAIFGRTYGAIRSRINKLLLH